MKPWREMRPFSKKLNKTKGGRIYFLLTNRLSFLAQNGTRTAQNLQKTKKSYLKLIRDQYYDWNETRIRARESYDYHMEKEIRSMEARRKKAQYTFQHEMELRESQFRKKKELILARKQEEKENLLQEMQRKQLEQEEEEMMSAVNDYSSQSTTKWLYSTKDALNKKTAQKIRDLKGLV
jgi:hypothetical protein